MHAIDLLNDKIDFALKKYTALQAENKHLKDIIAGQNLSLDSLSKQITGLENGMVSVRLDGMVVDENEKENMRKQLDNVIADIDKILATLND